VSVLRTTITDAMVS